jgi:hypothetical protein
MVYRPISKARYISMSYHSTLIVSTHVLFVDVTGIISEPHSSGFAELS